MGWIQSKIPDMPITNFTNDWNDGRAIGALVDGVAPGTTRISRFCLFDFVGRNIHTSPSWCVWNRFVSRLERLGSQRCPTECD